VSDYLSRGVTGTRALITAVRSGELSFIAASLAYYAFVSLFPLLLLVLVAASVFGGPRFAESVGVRVSKAIAPVAGDLIRDTLVAADVLGSATLVGLMVLLWTALRLFRGLDIAFSQLYGVDKQETFLERIQDAITGLVAVASGIGVMILISRLFSLSGVQFSGLLATPALILGISVALLPLYLLFPDIEISIGEAVPGTVFAATGWTVLGSVFRLYTRSVGSYDGYGIIGAVLLLVTWFYLGSLILLLGVIVNVVFSGRSQPGNSELKLIDPP
jgi:YihY family inner membrane protein